LLGYPYCWPYGRYLYASPTLYSPLFSWPYVAPLMSDSEFAACLRRPQAPPPGPVRTRFVESFRSRLQQIPFNLPQDYKRALTNILERHLDNETAWLLLTRQQPMTQQDVDNYQ
jgi:hypothetical protein